MACRLSAGAERPGEGFGVTSAGCIPGDASVVLRQLGQRLAGCVAARRLRDESAEAGAYDEVDGAGVRLESCRMVTEVSCAFRVRTAGRAADEAYSMTDLV